MRKLKNIMSLNGPIFVTGHTGFKGAWLTSLLDFLDIPWFGYSLEPEINSLYRRIGMNQSSREVFGDIRDQERISKAIQATKPSAIIHLAAQPLVLRSYEDPKYTFDVNVMGTANVLEAARISPSVEYVIVATTDKVYENLETGIPFRESDPLGGIDPYSTSKAAAEMVVQAWRNLGRHGTPMRISSVRAGNVIGGGDFSENRLMPDLIRGFLSGETVQIRNPMSVRPWQHVLDPLLGYLSVLDFGLERNPPRAVNFGPDGQGLSVSEVVKTAQDAWGAPTAIEYIGENLNYYEALHLDLDSDWARYNLGWENKYTQHQAIISTVKWWKAASVENLDAKQLVLDEIIEKVSNTTV